MVISPEHKDRHTAGTALLTEAESFRPLFVALGRQLRGIRTRHVSEGGYAADGDNGRIRCGPDGGGGPMEVTALFRFLDQHRHRLLAGP